MKFYKIWRTYCWVYSGHNCTCISNKSCVMPLHEMFYFDDVLQNWNMDCYCRMEKAGPFACCCSHHGVTVSLFVSELTVDILSTFYDGWFNALSWCWVNFCTRGFYCLAVLFIAKCNLSWTFYQTGRWGRRHNHSQICKLLSLESLERLAAVWWR